MAATNRPNSIDPALHHFGPFDCEVDIGIPDAVGREEILRIHKKNINLYAYINLVQIGKQTHGYIAADLVLVCSEAAVHQITEKMHSVDLEKDTIEAKILDPLTVS
ncbi:unnamed protein product [Adineta steineri]|uniref:AAA ATPase AAA+ lid domain-containing protein n=1 Tax=Adineta steineri TaxID=433720 RepID=A0A815RBI7_9BILA|nr:unnamed protein product [Adineta steineri]CAF4118123.1 unnamed protein product [Adineta steineri]